MSSSIIGESLAMKSLYSLIQTAANASANVLITGESGSGKELVAKSLHDLSSRKDKPFIAINCTAIPEHLLESELFGHAKGSFTGSAGEKKGLLEEACGGTFFLDEIGDMSLQLQAKLLRVLQDRIIRPVGSNHYKKIDVRIVAATHRNLKCMIARKEFREDLYYRLNVIPLYVPSLRERSEDIPLFIAVFVKKFNSLNNSKVKGLTKEAMDLLLSYSWPGNVRELENTIERAVVLSPKERIGKETILENLFNPMQTSLDSLHLDRPTLDQLEERYIKLILKENENKKEIAAHLLGISRRTLHRKEKDYGIMHSSIK